LNRILFKQKIPRKNFLSYKSNNSWFINYIINKANIEHISLNGEREVFVCLNLTKCELYDANKNCCMKNKLPAKYQYPSLKLGGNSMWQILNIPLTYISSNFPIKVT
jgi:hypothetical protein